MRSGPQTEADALTLIAEEPETAAEDFAEAMFERNRNLHDTGLITVYVRDEAGKLWGYEVEAEVSFMAHDLDVTCPHAAGRLKCELELGHAGPHKANGGGA